jgi:hypothetical protein
MIDQSVGAVPNNWNFGHGAESLLRSPCSSPAARDGNGPNSVDTPYPTHRHDGGSACRHNPGDSGEDLQARGHQLVHALLEHGSSVCRLADMLFCALRSQAVGQQTSNVSGCAVAFRCRDARTSIGNWSGRPMLKIRLWLLRCLWPTPTFQATQKRKTRRCVSNAGHQGVLPAARPRTVSATSFIVQREAAAWGGLLQLPSPAGSSWRANLVRAPGSEDESGSVTRVLRPYSVSFLRDR